MHKTYCTHCTHYTYPQLEGHDEVDVILVPECRQLHKVTVDVLVVVVLVLVRDGVRVRVEVRAAPPRWSKAVKWAALKAARSSTRGEGSAPSGPASSWEC